MLAYKVRRLPQPRNLRSLLSAVRELLFTKVDVEEGLKYLALQGYVSQTATILCGEVRTDGVNATGRVIDWRKNAGWRKSVSR